MNYCTSCGNELMKDANFCNKCGSKVEKVTNYEQNSTETNEVNTVAQNSTTMEEPKEKYKVESTDSILTKLKKEIFMQPTPMNESKMDTTTAQILHIISWVCFVLALFTVYEFIFSIIGYFLARTAMKSGINANAARWANLILSIIYLVIFIVAFIIGFLIAFADAF